MSLPHILLGMLKEPHSGYDIKKEFGQSLQHFWHAELSQIYPTLKRLERDGLVRSREGEQRSGPQRVEYRRTAKGRRELLAWLNAGPVTGSERIAYLAQVSFLAELDDTAAALTYFEALRRHMDEWLSVLTGVEDEWRSQDPAYPDVDDDGEFFSQLTLALGIAKVRTNRDWCDDCIRRLKKRSGR